VDGFAGGGADDAHVVVVDEHQDAGSVEVRAEADVVEAVADSQADVAGFDGTSTSTRELSSIVTPSARSTTSPRVRRHQVLARRDGNPVQPTVLRLGRRDRHRHPLETFSVYVVDESWAPGQDLSARWAAILGRLSRYFRSG
jgi:hypothetical protein